MRKPKVRYDVYERWYDKYASKGEMWQAKLSKKAFMAQWRDARSAGLDMQDFSKKVAGRQRQASELQLHATFGGTKQAMKEFGKNIRAKRREFINQELTDYITKTKGNLTEAELNKQIKRMKKKGVPEYIKIGAETKLLNYYQDQKTSILESMPIEVRADYQDMLSAYELVQEYAGMSFKDFKKEQTRIVRSARTLSEDRTIWDEAFALAFDSPKEKSA